MMRRAALLLAVAVSALLLAAALAALDWRDFLAALARVQPAWLAPAAALVVAAAALRAARWRLAAGAPAGFAPFWRAANLGNLGNVVYPLRAGEAVRIAALSRFAGLDPAAAAASSALDRAAEGVALLAVGAPALLLAAPALRAPDLRLALVVAAVLAAATALGLRTPRLRAAGGRFAASLRTLATARRIAPALALTALAYACDIGFTWAVLRALEIDAGSATAIVTNVFLVFAGLLPAAPAGLGAHQAASVLALGLFGAAPGEALAFSVLAQTLSALGAAALGLEGLRRGALRGLAAAR